MTASTRRCASSPAGRFELHQHAADVPLDGPLGQHQPARDAAVGEALGHQREHLALAGAQHREPVGRAAAHQRGDDLRIERRAAARDALRRFDEVGDVEHPILEQVAEPALRDQPDRPRRLDVLGEHEHADVRVGVADPARGADALVGVGRRHPHVDDGEVGLVLADRPAQPVGVADGGDHRVPAVLEQPLEPVAQQRPGPRRSRPARQLRDDHGPLAGRAGDRHAAAQRGDAVGDPGQPRALRRHRAADAVVVHPHDEAAVAARRGDVDGRRIARAWRRWRAPRWRRSRRRSRPGPRSARR